MMQKAYYIYFQSIEMGEFSQLEIRKNSKNFYLIPISAFTLSVKSLLDAEKRRVETSKI
jgi:hypothetical protein